MYRYQTERPKIFSDEGQRDFLKIRTAAMELIAKAGACRMQEILSASRITGDSWFMLACVDRMVELGEIREITGSGVCGQYRVFVSTQSQH